MLPKEFLWLPKETRNRLKNFQKEIKILNVYFY